MTYIQNDPPEELAEWLEGGPTAPQNESAATAASRRAWFAAARIEETEEMFGEEIGRARAVVEMLEARRDDKTAGDRRIVAQAEEELAAWLEAVRRDGIAEIERAESEGRTLSEAAQKRLVPASLKLAYATIKSSAPRESWKPTHKQQDLPVPWAVPKNSLAVDLVKRFVAEGKIQPAEPGDMIIMLEDGQSWALQPLAEGLWELPTDIGVGLRVGPVTLDELTEAGGHDWLRIVDPDEERVWVWTGAFSDAYRRVVPVKYSPGERTIKVSWSMVEES